MSFLYIRLPQNFKFWGYLFHRGRRRSLTKMKKKHTSIERKARTRKSLCFLCVHWICKFLIIHQTHYKKSDWSRAFNQFTIACELDMINVISAADITFIMSSSTSVWLLSPLECPPQKQNGWTLRFCFWGWIMWKCIIKQLLNLFFAWYLELSNPRVCVICLSLRFRQITQTSVLIIHDIMLNLIQ